MVGTMLMNSERTIKCYRCGYPAARSFPRCPECGFPVLKSRALWRYWRRAAPRVLSVALMTVLGIGLFVLHELGVAGPPFGDIVLMLCVLAVVIAVQRLLAIIPRPTAAAVRYAIIGWAVVVVGLCISATLAVLAHLGGFYVGSGIREAIGTGTWGVSMGVFWKSMAVAFRGLRLPRMARHGGVLAIVWPITAIVFSVMVWNRSPDYSGIPPAEFWASSAGLVGVVVDTIVLVLVLWLKVEAGAT